MRRSATISMIISVVGLGVLAASASADYTGIPYGTLTMSTSGKTVNFTLTLPFAVSSFDLNFKNSTAAVDAEDNLISMSASGFPTGSCKPNGGGAEYPGCGFEPVRSPTFYWPTIPANTPIVGSVSMAHISTGDTVFALGWNGNENPFVHNGFLPVAQTHEITVGSTSTGGGEARTPRVLGKPLASAETAIRKAGLKVGKVKHRRSSHVKKGDVISQSVSPGKTVAEGTTVALVVSSGK